MNVCGMKKVFAAGVRQLKGSYFPYMRTFDNNRHPRMYWSGKGILKVINEAIPSVGIQDSAKRMTIDVIWFLESKQLANKSKFVEYFRDVDSFVFPWMCDLLERLSEWNLENDHSTSVLAYLCCIALIQNVWFVYFQNLEKLHNRFVSQFSNFIQRLQKSQMLSFFSLSEFKRCHLKRLHESILMESDENQKSIPL